MRMPEKDLADATETVPFSIFLLDVGSARLYTISVRLQGGAIPGGSRGGHRPNREGLGMAVRKETGRWA